MIEAGLPVVKQIEPKEEAKEATKE
jgi:hypothetical protein